MDLEARKKLVEVVKMARGSMSQRGFGKLLGVSATAVQLWEKGDSIPDTENLANIAAKAGYTMEELLHYIGVKPMSQSTDVNQMVKQIKSMPLNEVAIVGRAAMERLAAAAEASVDKAKASWISVGNDMDIDKQSLYDQDFYWWTQQQAKALEQRLVLELDWQNLREEIQALGRQEYRELVSRLSYPKLTIK